MTLRKWEITKRQQYNNRILEAVIAHFQDAGHPIPYSKFSCPKMGRNIAKSSFAVEQDRRDYTILVALKRGNDARGPLIHMRAWSF